MKRDTLEDKLHGDISYRMALDFEEGDRQKESPSAILMQPTMLPPGLGIQVQVDAAGRARGPGKKRADQDWRLVKQKLYEVDFGEPSPSEEKQSIDALEARLNGTDSQAL